MDFEKRRKALSGSQELAKTWPSTAGMCSKDVACHSQMGQGFLLGNISNFTEYRRTRSPCDHIDQHEHMPTPEKL